MRTALIFPAFPWGRLTAGQARASIDFANGTSKIIIKHIFFALILGVKSDNIMNADSAI